MLFGQCSISSLVFAVPLLLCLRPSYATSIDRHFTPDLIRSYGYPVEIHSVTTEDGYILELHRIPHGRNVSQNSIKEDPFAMKEKRKKKHADKDERKRRRIVLLSHSFLSSSWSWIVLGPRKALALLLADFGFDVWLFNARGTIVSMKHKTISKKSKQFWKFSWHEHGVYDLPASIDYILNVTQQKQMDYVAYSMGAALYFILMSEKPQYSKKIDRVIALAPSAYNEFSDSISSVVSSMEGLFKNVGEWTNILEFPPLYLNLNLLFSSVCIPYSFLYQIACPPIMNLLTGSTHTYADKEKVPGYMKHAFDTSSLQTYQHYSQIRNTATFRPYDYGELKNVEMYNLEMPPNYNLSNSVNPVYVFWAERDQFTHPKDVFRLGKLLPNVALFDKIPLKSFSHRDFIWARNAPKLIYRKIIKILLS